MMPRILPQSHARVSPVHAAASDILFNPTLERFVPSLPFRSSPSSAG